jgi:hypothetical protein
MLLEGGRVVASGPTAEVIHRYQSGVGTNAASVIFSNPETRPGDGVVSLLSTWVEDTDGEHRFEYSLMEPLRISLEYRVHKPLTVTPQPNLHVTDSAGNYVFVTSPYDWGDERARDPGDYIATAELPGHFLNDGMYSVGVALNHFESGLQTAFFERGTLSFNIVDRIGESELRAVSRWGGRVPGVVRPLLHWNVEKEAR